MVAVAVWYVATMFWNMPRYRRVEGFEGVFRVPEAEGLLRTVERAAGSAEHAEFGLLLQKMGALRADLEGAGSVIHATKGIAFETAHDRMAVAEVCGMCFTHTIAPRDLDIVFITWRDRGSVLLRRLCTLADLREVDAIAAEKQFSQAWESVYAVAKARCLVTVAGESPGEVRGVETAATRAYEGRASGWNGTI